MLDATALFRNQASIQNRDEQPLALLTLSHPYFETMRFVSDVMPVTSNGRVFTAFPFSFAFPGEAERIPSTRITIQNVTAEIGRAIKAVKGPITAVLEAVLRSEPDLVVASTPNMLLQNVRVSGAFVSGTLSGRQRVNSAWPGVRANPDLTPGMHWS